MQVMQQKRSYFTQQRKQMDTPYTPKIDAKDEKKIQNLTALHLIQNVQLFAT